MNARVPVIASIEAEMAVVGGLLQDDSALPDIGHLRPDDFTRHDCRETYRAILAVHADRLPVDLVTVAERMERDDTLRWAERGLATLASWVENTAGVSNVRTYADLIHGKARSRAAQAIGARLFEQAAEPTAVDDAIRDLLALNVERREWVRPMRAAVADALERVEEAAEGRARAITTGLRDLDRRISGWHDGDLVVIGARPSVGKTAFLVGCALHAGVPAGVISAEQPAEQIGLRAIAADGKVSLHRLRLGALQTEDDWSRVAGGSTAAAARPVWLYDRPAPSIEDVVRQARRWKHEHGIRVLYVDYLQRIRVARGLDRAAHERVGEIAMCLKELARDLAIPVVVLAQVNREVEKRPNKRPGMSDLKDSGTIEQEADLVLTLYRDEVYNDDTRDAGVAEVVVAKNRHGPTGMVKCAWLAEYATFADLDRHPGAYTDD